MTDPTAPADPRGALYPVSGGATMTVAGKRRTEYAIDRAVVWGLTAPVTALSLEGKLR